MPAMAGNTGGHITIHIVESGVGDGLRRLVRTAIPKDTPGLRRADVMTCAPLRARSGPPRPQLGRTGIVASWDSAAAADEYLAAHPAEGGWSARLTPLRAVPEPGGHYPGIPTDVNDPSSATADTAPVAVLTIAHTKVARLIPFLRASARAEAGVHDAPGLLWSTGMADLPRRLAATFSLWSSAQAAHDYATGPGGHRRAMAADVAKPFHHHGSFVRMRVEQSSGSLSGRNPYMP